MKTPAPVPPPLTRAESEIMAVLWSKGGGTVHDVLGGLERPVAYTTALTVLRILVTKGYVAAEPSPEGGRAHFYRPAVPAGEARARHLKDFIGRFFSGKPSELVAGLLEDEELSRAELEALRAEIDAKLGGKRRKS